MALKAAAESVVNNDCQCHRQNNNFVVFNKSIAFWNKILYKYYLFLSPNMVDGIFLKALRARLLIIVAIILI